MQVDEERQGTRKLYSCKVGQYHFAQAIPKSVKSELTTRFILQYYKRYVAVLACGEWCDSTVCGGLHCERSSLPYGPGIRRWHHLLCV